MKAIFIECVVNVEELYKPFLTNPIPVLQADNVYEVALGKKIAEFCTALEASHGTDSHGFLKGTRILLRRPNWAKTSYDILYHPPKSVPTNVTLLHGSTTTLSENPLENEWLTVAEMHDRHPHVICGQRLYKTETGRYTDHIYVASTIWDLVYFQQFSDDRRVFTQGKRLYVHEIHSPNTNQFHANLYGKMKFMLRSPSAARSDGAFELAYRFTDNGLEDVQMLPIDLNRVHCEVYTGPCYT